MRVLVNRVARRVTGRPFERYCTSDTEIHPAESLPGRPGIFFEEDVAKIKTVVNGDVRYQIDKARGLPDDHLPTRAYTYRNVSVQGGYVLSGLGLAKYHTSLGALREDPHKEYESAFLSSNALSGREFGHWVRDCLVAETYAAQVGLPSVAVGRNPWQHEPGFRALSERQCTYSSNMFIRNLTVLDDRGLNSFWAERFLRVRDRIQQNAAALAGTPAGEKIFLRRGGSARPREPRNTDAVDARLQAMGFRTIVPTDMTVDEIAVALRNAKIVVSAEGSHLNHVHYFCPPNIKLLIIQDPWRFSVFHKRFVDINDGLLSFIVGDPHQEGVYDVDTDALSRLVDEVDRFAFYTV